MLQWNFAKRFMFAGKMTPPQITSTVLLISCALFVGFSLPSRLTPAQRQVASVDTSSMMLPQRDLIVPVANAPPGSLADTWGAARGGGRTHEGIDIMAAEGTPVLAAADGQLVRFFDSERGGVTIYQFDEDEQFVFYYAHLSTRANVREGQSVRQGDVIGFVGQTGNAPVPHLHFEIQRLTPGRKWWDAVSINPYPYLLSGRAPPVEKSNSEG